MIFGSKIMLRDKKLADARNDYAWRIDPELAYLDAAPPLTTTFPEYLSDYTSQLHYLPLTRHEFAIDTLDGKHIGNCVYYGVNEAKGEAELGIMIGDRDCWDKSYGTDAVTTLVSYIFHQTSLKRIYLKTLDSNSRAQKCFQKCGFTPYGRRAKDGFNFLLMEIYREQWEKWQTKT
ncbi:GNAT family N-acetyltransferase [Chloroflexota bacterium]